MNYLAMSKTNIAYMYRVVFFMYEHSSIYCVHLLLLDLIICSHDTLLVL